MKERASASSLDRIDSVRTESFADLKDGIQVLRDSVEGVIRGKTEVVNLALVTLFARGHLLIEDVPGVGKTMLAEALARSLDATFRRIQFTSDLLPSDIVGVAIFNPARGQFEFRRGPVFAHVVLADEINRSTPKTQSALLEAMNEAQVTVDDASYPLPSPFIVLATQNPVEHHGTFPLPESQLDRFLMCIRMGYPDEQSEKEILRAQQFSHPIEQVRPVLTLEEVKLIQNGVRSVRVDPVLADYLVGIAAATRRSDQLTLGVSPRGALLLQRAAQAHAVLCGRDYMVPDDVKAVAIPVLAHRVLPRSHSSVGSGRGREAERIIQHVLENVAVPL